MFHHRQGDDRRTAAFLLGIPLLADYLDEAIS
jgi:hypothetical protein